MPRDVRWRVGRKVGRTLYLDDALVGLMDTPEMAAQAAAALNGAAGDDLSAALDEIHRLRSLLAYEADVLAVHADYKSFPKGRRQVVDGSLSRMRQSARGHSAQAIAGINSRSLRASLKTAGASECLTVSQWREEASNA